MLINHQCTVDEPEIPTKIRRGLRLRPAARYVHLSQIRVLAKETMGMEGKDLGGKSSFGVFIFCHQYIFGFC